MKNRLDLVRAGWLALVLCTLTSCGGGGGGSGSGDGGGAGGGGGGGGGSQPPAATTFNVGGSISGLASGQSLTLRNGGEDLIIAGNGSFAFVTKLTQGASYSIALVDEPQDRQCAVVRGQGTVANADVMNAVVDCKVPAHWITDGNVLSTALSPDGRTLYLAGDFSQVGPRTGGFVPLDAGTGAVAAFPAVNGRVAAQVPDGAGGWYLGGSFIAVGDVRRRYLAHVLADGSVDPHFSPDPDGPVSALGLTAGRLFVGGDFSRIGAAGRPYLAALSPTTGQALIWSVTVNGPIRLLAVSADTVYVSGAFSTMNGQPRAYLGAVDAVGAGVTAWNPQATNNSGVPVFYALRTAGSNVYVAGRFFTIGGEPRQHVAALDGATGAATAWDARVNAGLGSGEVFSLAVDGDVVYLGGQFETVGGQPRAGLAAVDAADGAVRSWHPDVSFDGVFPPFVRALATSGDSVFVAGQFRSIGSQAALNIAAVDKATGSARAWFAGAPFEFTSLDVVGTQVWVGGGFATIGGKARRHLAAIDTKTGLPTDWDPAPTEAGGATTGGAVLTVAASGSRVYVAGTFRRIGGADRGGIAAIDAASGAALPWVTAVVGSVRSIAIAGNTAYLGGYLLSSVDGQARRNLAAVDADTGTVLPWAPDAGGNQINKLVATPSTIYAAGIIDGIGGQSRRGGAAFAADTGALLPWNPNVDNGGGAFDIVDIALRGSLVYMTGSFTNAGGAFRPGVAAVDAVTAVASSWPSIGVLSARALAIDDNTVYVATHRGGGDLPGAGIVGISLATGQATSFKPDVEGSVNSLSLSSGTVYAGGDFTGIRGLVGQGVAFFAK